MAITWLQIEAVQNIRQLASIWVSSKVWWFMQSYPWGHLHCQVTKLAAIHQHVGEYSSSQSKKMIFLFVQQYNLTIGRLEAFCTYIYIYLYMLFSTQSQIWSISWQTCVTYPCTFLCLVAAQVSRKTFLDLQKTYIIWKLKAYMSCGISVWRMIPIKNLCNCKQYQWNSKYTFQ